MVCVHEKYMMILMIPCLFDDEMIIKLLKRNTREISFLVLTSPLIYILH